MTTSTMPRGVRMRKIASADDSFAAAEILAQAATDDLEAVRELVPSGTTPNPVEIAEDGSAAIFEVYAGNHETSLWQSHAVGEIRSRYTAWEAELFGQEGDEPR